MTLRVTFLGTSAAVPTTERNPSAVFVNREGDQFLFDAGEGTQRQMMRFGTGFGVTDVFLTHLHGDHVLGLPGLLQTWAFNDRSAPLRIHTPSGTGSKLRQFLFSLTGRPSFPVTIREVVAGEKLIEAEDYIVRTISTAHDTRAVGYALVETDRKGRFDRETAEALGVPVGPLFSKLHRGEVVELNDGTIVDPDQVVGPPRPGRHLVYTGDTRPTESVIDAATNADLLIHDATFADAQQQRARETAHATARQAGEVAAAANAKRLVLTHISSRYAGDASGHAEEARETFAGPVSVAHDGLELEIQFPDTGSN